MMSVMIIQFICRGNAFRSIIAEAYLNSLRIPGLTVLSSGTVASQYKNQNSVNFPKTLDILKKHGIEQYAKNHYADDVTQEMIDKSDIVIFLNKRAYDEAARMLKLPPKFDVWDVTDIGEEGRIATSDEERESFSEDVYLEITRNIDTLIASRHLKG